MALARKLPVGYGVTVAPSTLRRARSEVLDRCGVLEPSAPKNCNLRVAMSTLLEDEGQDDANSAAVRSAAFEAAAEQHGILLQIDTLRQKLWQAKHDKAIINAQATTDAVAEPSQESCSS
eukprot:SAG31_NODE_3998_length_3677_cov_10.286193_4_plen_120_part_00